MKYPKLLLVVCVIALCLKFDKVNAQTYSSWRDWFLNQLHQHPDVQAAKQKLNASLSSADANKQPLYNPELSAEYEAEGNDDNYLVGINQTLDWSNKQAIKKQQAQFLEIAAKQSYQLAIQAKSKEMLNALIIWQGAKNRAQIAQQQEKRLSTLLELVKSRQQTGDFGLVDAELTFLSLSQKLNNTAQAISALKQAEAQLQALFTHLNAKEPRAIPKTIWLMPDQSLIDQWLQQHPKIQLAKARWQLLEQTAILAQRSTKADPSIGFNLGRSEGDNVVGLVFSIPINIRNNFSAQSKAASFDVLSAESAYQAALRQQRYAMFSAYETLIGYQQYFDRWQALMTGRSERTRQLLEQQWQSGDLSTPDYLLALQQRAEGLLAGIELNEQLLLAHLTWLVETGQVNRAINGLLDSDSGGQ